MSNYPRTFSHIGISVPDVEKAVEFKTDARNLRSQHALERIGATREGVLRNHMIVQNDFLRDSVYFSVLVGEWPEVKRRLQALREQQAISR